eukprot:COSAG03_NODE_222_length_10374_cov_5.932360_8_plen_64_part_00
MRTARAGELIYEYDFAAVRHCEAMYTSCRDQAPVEYVRGSLLLSTDGLPQWNPSEVHTRYVVQ